MVNVIVQDAIEPNEELTKLGVPHIMTFVKDDTNRKVVELILSQQVFHRSFIAPPGTAPAQLAILRKAFDATMKDPQFIADADKLRIDLAPLSGERVQEVVRNLYRGAAGGRRPRARRDQSVTTRTSRGNAIWGRRTIAGCCSPTCAALGACIAAPAAAQDYYASRSIDLIIGSGPAGGYDIYGRALARHLNRHIPGKPNIVVKNMPGAGSGRAAGFLAKIAPKDGTVIAGIMPGAVMGPLLEDKPEILFDPVRVQYLGTANNGTRVCVGWAAAGVKSFDDVRAKEVPFGAVSPNESTHDYAFMLKKTAGAKYKVVSGYNGTTEIGLAMERGEVVGSCGWDWASVRRSAPTGCATRSSACCCRSGSSATTSSPRWASRMYGTTSKAASTARWSSW